MSLSSSKVTQFSWKKLLLVSGVSIAALLVATGLPKALVASDHDDGEVDTKGRNLNLTDLYAYREKDQNPNAREGDLILTMNSNPRSIARQQYFFSTNARYEFKLTRVGDKEAAPTGQEDITLRFEFGAPNDRNQQPIKFTVVKDGKEISTSNMRTTALNEKAHINQLGANGAKIAVFAGLREDSHFFDVEQFFRVRAGALGTAPGVGFRAPDRAVDSFKGYNVNAIALRIPQEFLSGRNGAKTYDIWETISLRDGNGKYQQVERLARPAINEGLLTSNSLLNAFNSVPPTADLSPAAAPIAAEASLTLKAFGNNDNRIKALFGALLPDVMRIDTTEASGYNMNGLNKKGSPIRGRMIKDDVIDFTLSVLTEGKVKTDNVSYEGSNPAQGHKALEGSFPYLALPN